jgi:hypothetical protein
MKFLIKNHKDRHGKYDNQFHGAYTRIFKILEQDALGFVQEFWEESFTKIEGTQDWILEVGGDSPDAHRLEEILNIKNVEEYKHR